MSVCERAVRHVHLLGLLRHVLITASLFCLRSGVQVL